MKHDQLDYLTKIANQLVVDDPMNPEYQPTPTAEDVANIQAENVLLQGELANVQDQNAALEEAAAQIIAGANAGGQTDVVPDTDNPGMTAAMQAQEEPTNMEQEPVTQNEELQGGADIPQDLSEEELAHLLATVDEAELQNALNEKVAQEMFELGTLAKVIECAKGDLGEDFQKNAFEIINYISQGETQYYEGIQKIASDLFGEGCEENTRELFTPQGILYTFEQLASVDDEGFLKQANEGAFDGLRMAVGNAIGNAKEKIVDAAKSVTELSQVQGEIEAARTELDTLRMQVLDNQIPVGHEQDVISRIGNLEPHLESLKKRQMLGKGIVGSGAALATGAALVGGNKIYNALRNDGEVLQQEKTSGTLETEYEKLGGITMNKEQQLTHDFLKIAGAAMLVTVANDESVDMELRKEAAATFEGIANMRRKDMGEEFAKVALELYPEDQLREIVANQHTDVLLEKVAYFLEANELSTEELEKTANAGGVMATKNVGAGLSDAAANIKNTLAEEKAKTEGAGREYVGNTNSTGQVGGDLVDSLAGYTVIKNPGEHGVAKTASEHVEALFMQKQAAARAFEEADQQLKALFGN